MPEQAWYHWCINEIRDSRKRLSDLDKAYLIECEANILEGKPLPMELEDYLMQLYNRCTDVRRLRR